MAKRTRKPSLDWSCDERNRKECRNAHGCHCREITALREMMHPEPLGELDMHFFRGPFGLRIIGGEHPQAQLYSEDDGNYFLKMSFSVAWLDSLLLIAAGAFAHNGGLAAPSAISSDHGGDATS